jgi:transcriptional regulator with XRE-family HTH domain
VDVGKNVKRLRKEQRYTQTEIARRCGVTPAAISGLEAGDFSPSTALVVKMARALGVEPAELLREPALAAGKDVAPTEGAGPQTLEELLERAGIPGPHWLTRPKAEFESFWRGVELEEARDRYWQIHREYQALREEWENQKRGAPLGAPELQERMPDIYTDAFARHFYAQAAAPGEGEPKGEFRAREQRGDTRPLREVEPAPGASGVATEGLAG